MSELADFPGRFQTKVRVLDSGCWEWLGNRSAKGYGRFKWQRKNQNVHRMAYIHAVGPIPEGLVLDHFLFPDGCIGPPCANPDHLRPVSQQENILRGQGFGAVNAAKTHCPHGHPFDEANTYLIQLGLGRTRRQCRTCQLAWGARRRDAARRARNA